MKKTIISGIKIYLFLALLLLVGICIYSFYLSNTNNDFSNVGKLILSGLFFLLVGMCFGNAFHKKGLLVGLLFGVINLLLIKFIFFLITGTMNFEILLFFINITLSGLGGIIGVNIKKIF